MKKIWHPYWLWEDWNAGMWRKVDPVLRPELLKQAIKFTGDHELYGKSMRQIIVEWPWACEHNLTDVHMNRLAWIGHAACCKAINCPEDIARNAWGQLTQLQQDKANQQALNALNQWEKNYQSQNSQLCLDLEAQGI